MKILCNFFLRNSKRSKIPHDERVLKYMYVNTASIYVSEIGIRTLNDLWSEIANDIDCEEYVCSQLEHV